LDPTLKLFQRMRSKTIEQLDCVPDRLLMTVSPDNRTVAQLFAHINDGVCIWMRGQTDRWTSAELGEEEQHSREKLREALVESGKNLLHLFTVNNGELLIQEVSPIGNGADLLCYLAAHEAHHHGEIATLVLQAGQKEVHKKLWAEGKEI
jgi:uncharacterized damage-inducible protein DinB